MSTPKKGTLKTATLSAIAEPIKRFATHNEYPDAESEFIAELSGHITKWGNRPGKDAIAITAAYKKLLCELLTPDTTN